jgi:hypothetical protein
VDQRPIDMSIHAGKLVRQEKRLANEQRTDARGRMGDRTELMIVRQEGNR